MRATVVSFTPGARTAWHAHPVGQTLYCLSGVGRICIGKGSRPQAIYPGDTVMIPPDTMHWHGAAPDRLFAHLAMSENGEQGQGTSWAEQVSDSDYKFGAGDGLTEAASPEEGAGGTQGRDLGGLSQAARAASAPRGGSAAAADRQRRERCG